MSNNAYPAILATTKGAYIFWGSLVLKLTDKGPVVVDPDMIAPKEMENITQLIKATDLYINTKGSEEYGRVHAEAGAIMTSKVGTLRNTVKKLEAHDIKA